MKIKYTILALGAATGVTSAATVITPTSVTGHEDGDNVTGNGSIDTLINLAGITQTGGAMSPSTWTHTNSWQTDWQGTSMLNPATSANGKRGWVVIDFGSAQTLLGDMLIWNANETSVPNRGTATFNIYHASAPTVSAPAVSGTATDYDFASGGWTQLGGTENLTQGDATVTRAS